MFCFFWCCPAVDLVTIISRNHIDTKHDLWFGGLGFSLCRGNCLFLVN